MTLQLLQVDHRYGRHASLQGVSLELRPGDCYGFIGHNGAGKTTALRIAVGLMRPAAGRVVVDGFDAARDPREARARVGALVETTGFYPWASGRQNLVLLARLGGLGRRAAGVEADRRLEQVGLVEAGRRAVGAYSQGMRQRLGLAQALLGDPRYLLLDEPTNGLDPEGIADLRALLRQLADEGRGVLFSSHQLLEVAELCNRIGVLRAGRLLVEADTGELLAAEGGRCALSTDAPDATRRVLDELRLAHERAPDGRWRVELGETPAPELVRALVGAGVGVQGLERRAASLEEVYLRLAEAPPDERPGADAPPAPAGDAPRLAPRMPVLRVLAHELRLGARRWPVLLMLAAPAAVAVLRVARLARGHAEDVAAVERGDLFSTSTVTAFEALGRGLQAALPVAALLLAALASQSIAGDLALGTLRNVLLRPLRRWHVATGKFLAVLAATAACFALLVATAAAASARWFDFGDRFELSRDGEPELWITAADVSPYVPGLLGFPLLALALYAGLGFLAGAVARRGRWALGLALLAVAALDVLRAVARPGGWEAWLPSAHLPSPLGDTSYVAFFVDLAIGSAEAFFEYRDAAVALPCAGLLASFALATALLQRRRVP